MIYDDEFRSFAVEYYYAAGSFRKAAADLGISPGSLHSCVTQSPGQGEPLPPRDPLQAAHYPKETIRLILGLVYGWPKRKLKEASDVFDISISAIHA